MNILLKIFLSMSFSGALLILLLLVGKRFFKDKISRQWQYYIWLIVIVRLLLPLGPETNLMGKTYQTIDQAITHSVSLPQQPLSSGNSNAFNVPASGMEHGGQNTVEPKDNSISYHPVRDILSLFANHVWLIWLMVALILLVQKITAYHSFLRYVNAGLHPVSNVEQLDRLSAIAEQTGRKRPVELCVNPLVSSPLLIGFFRPCIVLPSADISEKDFQYIVLHELTHYKRRDMFYKWLVQITVCLHWFNPLVYLMRREITKACEFSCDEAVLSKMGYDNAQDYGETLLDAMAAVGKYKESLAAVTLSENKQLLKERLGAIMNLKKQSKAAKVLTVMLTLCAIIGASFIGIYTISTATDQAHAAAPSGVQTNLTDNPSLSLDISSCAVNVLPAADGKISAEYNSEVYDVKIDEQEDSRKVSISCKTRTNTNDETIKLYIPAIAYGNIDLNIDSAHFTCDLIKSGNITGEFNMASVFLVLPEGFSGSLDAVANSGYFQLISKDDFKNTNTTITDNGEWGEIYTPKDFKENGDTYSHTNGTENNIIKVTRKGSGVMGIYSSNSMDVFNMEAFDSSDFPEEWKNLWSDTWQGTPWEEDWWQNSWKEDDEN